MAHDIFISYSIQDKDTAEAVCNALEAENIDCWIAPRDITPGVKYAEAIVDAINQCRVFLLVLSAVSNDSPQVVMEVDRAASKDLPILTFRVDEVVLTKSLEYYLSSRHWLDASQPPLEKHLHMLSQTVRRLLPLPGKVRESASPLSKVEVKIPAKPPAIVRHAKVAAVPQVTGGEAVPSAAAPANPFAFGNPIRDPDRFYGRSQEIRQIINRLLSSAHESTSLVGERRIGKTSLLNHLSNPQVAARLGLTPDKFCLVYVDFQGLTDITPQRFWQRVLGKIAHSVCDESLTEPIQRLSEQSEFDLFDLEDLFDTVVSRGLTMVLLMDEFEYVTQNPNFKGDFFGGLRALAIHHGLALVPSTRRELVDLCHSNELKGSPFFNIFANVVLRPFTRLEVKELLAGYLVKSKFAFTLEEEDFIWRQAGGYPFFVQMAGYYLVEAKMQGLSGKALTEYAVSNFEQQASGHYSHLWSSCSDSEKTILLAVHALGLQKGSRQDLTGLENLARLRSRAAQDAASLGKRGLLEEHEGAYALFSASFAGWICQELLAATGDEEPASSVEKWLRANSDCPPEVKSILPRFKKKYWHILADVARGFSGKTSALELLQSLT